MAIDLSWLWDLLNSIVSTIQSWFSSLWSTVQSIVNTGQGIFMGLVALGSQLWDAFIKGLSAFGEWLYKQFEWIYNGIVYWANVFGQWVNMAFGWIGSGISWLAQQVYNFGNWLYNLGVYVVGWFVNVIATIWNNILTWWGGVATAIGTWWASVISGINTWFTNLLRVFRTKIVRTIEADLTISMAWKGAERFLSPTKLSDFGYGLAGIVAAPIIGRLVGSIVDAVVPLPSSSVYPLIPDIMGFAYTPTPISVPTPTAPTPPSMGYGGQPIPTPPGWFVGVWEKESKIELTVDTNIATPATKSASIGATVDVSLAPQDGQANILLTYETEIA